MLPLIIVYSYYLPQLFLIIPNNQSVVTLYSSASSPIVSIFGSRAPDSYFPMLVRDMLRTSATYCCVYPAFSRALFRFVANVSLNISSLPLVLL